MADTFSSKTKKASASQAAETPKFETPNFEMPKFEAPKFDVPNLEIPAAFREFAEKGVTQVRDNWEKMKTATEEATGVIEDSYNTATKGVSDYGLKVIEMTRTNTNATFDFYAQLMTLRSISEVVELTTAHVRQQFETVTAQTKDLSSFVQKVATESVEPIKDSVASVFKKVA